MMVGGTYIYAHDDDVVHAELSESYPRAPIAISLHEKSHYTAGPVWLNLTTWQAETLAGDLLAVLAQVKEGAA